ncbi:conserved protein of unknown function [Enterobacter cancerogenus]|nr:hypothetical protein ENTCAN_05672 [Enterobacter cancerogenus ATCC 35316]CAD5354588.1 conserved protein of unknown function [Enterobacter cancerogenus]
MLFVSLFATTLIAINEGSIVVKRYRDVMGKSLYQYVFRKRWRRAEGRSTTSTMIYLNFSEK